MRLLLLGPDGQVGFELRRSLAPLGELVALCRSPRDGLSGDLDNAADLARTIATLEPQVIVNAAAYTAVDLAESQSERTERVNVEGPRILAREAARIGALLVHYSTDYVFDGSGETPWRETDSPRPLSVYGASKWRGEEAVRNGHAQHLIFRTQWIYSARGKNFIRTMLHMAQNRESLDVIDDQVGAPTGADLVADVTAHAIRSVLNQPALVGTYHLAASGETTWYGYARFILDEARRAGWPLRVSMDAIRPVSSDAFPTAARRPRNSRLSTAKLERHFSLVMPDWKTGSRRALMQIMAMDAGGNAQ